MAQTIRLKRQSQTGASAVGKVPTPASLLDGELAVNTVDGKLFLKKSDGSGNSEVIEVGANPFPSQTGNGGKFLTSNGTNVSWSTPGTVSAAAIDIVQAGHGFAPGTILYHDGTSYQRAQANSTATADVIGMVTSVATVDKFTLTTNGFVNMHGQPGWIDGAWVPGSTYYLSASVAGTLTPIEPTAAGEINKPLLVAVNSTSYSANDPNSGGPRGFFYNWRGVANDIPESDVDNLLPLQDGTTVGKALTSGADGNAYWGAGGGSGGGANASIVVQQTNHNLSIGQLVRYDGALSLYVKAQANNATNADVIGIVSAVSTVDEFTVTTQGMVTGLSGLAAGASYFLSATTAGALSATEPTGLGEVSKPVLMATSNSAGVFVNMRGIGVSVLDTTKEVASQSGNNGKVLSTNGTNTLWVTSPVGYTGSAGTQGLVGYTGSAGTNGTTGSIGPIGYTGSAGGVGYTGSIGYTGSTGATGTVSTSSNAVGSYASVYCYASVSNIGLNKIPYTYGQSVTISTNCWISFVYDDMTGQTLGDILASSVLSGSWVCRGGGKVVGINEFPTTPTLIQRIA